MRHTLSSILLFLVVASLALACEAVTHANDFGVASTQVDTCADGTLLCNGSCVPEDAKNCGQCGSACSGGQVCSAGTCASGCTDGTTQCGGLCVDTQTDPKNCGQCGGPADAGSCPFCQAGQCQSACASPSSVCGALCVDTASDPSNCGTCNTKCRNETPLCDHSKCVASCGSETACNDHCVDFAGDPDNCNGCHSPTGTDNFKCAAPDPLTGVAACVASACKIACNFGLTFCSDSVQNVSVPVCVDLTSNVRHCGSCGNSCLGVTGTNEVCLNGKCFAPPG